MKWTASTRINAAARTLLALLLLTGFGLAGAGAVVSWTPDDATAATDSAPDYYRAFAADKSLTTEALLDSLQRTAFEYFWEQANPGLKHHLAGCARGVDVFRQAYKVGAVLF